MENEQLLPVADAGRNDGASEELAGRAVQLSSARMEPAAYPVPTMNVAINTLEPGGDQRPHRHNGAAITLAIEGEGVYSRIEDEQVDWSTGAAQVTPATELHSHHNRGPRRMVSLVAQMVACNSVSFSAPGTARTRSPLREVAGP